MSDSFILVQGTSQKIDTRQVITGSGAVQRQVGAIGDPATGGAVATVGKSTMAAALNVVQASDYIPVPFNVGVALGLYAPNFIAAYRSGRNTDVDAAVPRELWYGSNTGVPGASNIRVLPTAAQTHRWVSSSASDAAAGTGLRTILVEYIEGSDYSLQQQVVALNGVTPVNMTGTPICILTATGLTTGSTGAAVGIVTCTAVTDGTLQAAIPIAETITRMGTYMVPAGYTALFDGSSVDISHTTGGAIGGILVEILAFGTTSWNQLAEVRTRADASNVTQLKLSVPYPVPEKSIIRLIGFSDTANMQITGIYSMVLRKNTWVP